MAINLLSVATLLMVISLPSVIEGYRILGLFPHPGKSHYVVFSPLMKGLARRGHEVVVVSYFPEETPRDNYMDLKFDKDLDFTGIYNISEAYTERGYLVHFREAFELAKWGQMACEDALTSSVIDKVLEMHSQKPFDFVITEFFNTDCMLGVIWKMKIPFGGLSSCSLMPWLFDRVATPDTPSFIASEFIPYSDNMNYWQRFTSFTVTKATKYMYRWLAQRSDNAMIEKKFGKGVPDVADIALNTSFLLINQAFALHGPRPTSTNLIEVGGIHIQEQKPIPDDLQQILDNSKHGVIILSMGSNINGSTMTTRMKDGFLRAFKELKQDVIWKYEIEMLDAPLNVHIKKWLPQRDILCHPKVKLFISHCGMLGSLEAVHCGVPVIGIPFYGDQPLNTAAFEYREIGVKLSVEDIEYSTVLEAAQKMLDPVVKRKAELISKALRNTPLSPLDTAIFWVEYVLQFDRAMMVSHARHLNWFVYHSLDVIVPLLGGAVLVVLLTCKLCGCVRHPSGRKQKVL